MKEIQVIGSFGINTSKNEVVLKALIYCFFLLSPLFVNNSIAKEIDVLVSRTAYEFPFEEYQDWLDFMDKAPDPAWHSDAMRTLIPKEAFYRYRDQKELSIDRITYSSDGLRINGYVIIPKAMNKPMPVVLYAHGGVGRWGRITFFDLLELFRLSEQGYVVIASALRGEGGSEGEPNLGAGDRRDMLRLIRVAQEFEGADTERVGLWGFSRGGGLGYRVLASTNKIKAAALVGASSDLVNSSRREEFDTHVYPGIVDGYERDKDEALKALSASYWPERLSETTPILLIHGADDKRVNVENSLVMASHLKRLNRSHQFVQVDKGSHSLIENWRLVRSKIDSWFNTYLVERVSASADK